MWLIPCSPSRGSPVMFQIGFILRQIYFLRMVYFWFQYRYTGSVHLCIEQSVVCVNKEAHSNSLPYIYMIQIASSIYIYKLKPFKSHMSDLNHLHIFIYKLKPFESHIPDSNHTHTYIYIYTNSKHHLNSP